MVGEGIDWDKVQTKPDKPQKVPGTTLIGMRDAISAGKAEIEKLKAEVSTLSGAKSNLEGKVSGLEADLKSRDEKIFSLEADLSSKESKLEEKVSQEQSLSGELDGLKRALQEKLSVAEEKIHDLGEKVFSLQAGRNRLIADYLGLKAALNLKIGELNDEKRLLIDKIVMMETEGVTPKDELEAKMLMTSATIGADNSVRACVTCRQYVELVEGEYKYQRAMEIFEGHHRGHMLSTITMSEVPRGFVSVTEEFLERAS